MNRTPLIAGNLKMHLDRARLRGLLDALRADLDAKPSSCEVLVCPVSVHLADAALRLEGSSIALGGQNAHFEAEGAFTGEVAPGMLRDVGCTHVILGHSERRTLFGETDALVRRKAQAAVDAGLVPVVCVGETEEEKQAGATEVVLSRQIVGALGGLRADAADRVVVAYEPVWAIGTGRSATPELAQEAHAHVRRELGAVLGQDWAAGIRILYGGSVKPGNASDLLGRPDIDGALVGGASLKAESFLPIVRAALP